MEETKEPAAFKCSRCFAPLPCDATFCGYCGTATGSAEYPVRGSLVCAKCDNKALTGSLFCGYCGALIDGNRAQEEQLSSRGGEDASIPVRTSKAAKIGGFVSVNHSRLGRSNRKLWIPIGLGVVATVIFVVRHKEAISHNSLQLTTAPTEPSATSATPSSASTPMSSVSTPPALTLLTKDLQFMRLLHPPRGDDLLEMNTEYTARKQQIQSKLASIQDPELRQRLSNEEWGKVDKSAYIKNEDEYLRASFPSAMRACLERHRTDTFEFGHVEYLSTGTLRISSVEASPLELSDGASISMDVATIDAVYSKFRNIAKDQIKQNGDAWVHEQSCSSGLKNTCLDLLGGTPEECSDPAKLREIEASLGKGGVFADCKASPSLEEGQEVAEKKVRTERLVLVGKGDLIDHRIDKLMLVDYDTEAVLLEISAGAIIGTINWKFPATNQSGTTRVPSDTKLRSDGVTGYNSTRGSSPIEGITLQPKHEIDLTGNWRGKLANHDTNQTASIGLQISKDGSNYLVGTLSFDLGRGDAASCQVNGVYDPRTKFMLLKVERCEGNPPTYLQGIVGFPLVSPTSTQLVGVDSAHNNILTISR